MDKVHQIVDNLNEKYKDNEYVNGRLINYIENLLPAALESDALTYKQREERKKQLMTFKDDFTTRFLHKNNYFYSPQTELFLMYDGTHFIIYSEDDITHQILTTITSEQSLRVWKHKIKNNIIKRIKERSPLNAIPESTTIQYVINSIYPTIFSTRNEAKYFLAIVGDCMLTTRLSNIINQAPALQQSSALQQASAAQATLQPSLLDTSLSSSPSSSKGIVIQGQGQNDIIYIISPAAKDFLREISNHCYTFFGISNIFNNIKYKYYDHEYTSCRLISINDQNKNKNIAIPTTLNKYMLDLLCVAAHYSKRYLTADNFLKQCSDTKLSEHAFYLHKNNLEKIVDNFIDEMLVKEQHATIGAVQAVQQIQAPAQALQAPQAIQAYETAKIDNKNMLFLWKRFLDARKVPNIVFHNSLKTILKTKLKYDEESDSFKSVTSSYLPLTSNFMRFWETTITEDEGEYELEIDEITKLFKGWVTGRKAGLIINEDVVLKVICHFYPEIVIEEDKYILHIKCNLWEKKNEILNSLEMFKYECNGKQQTMPSSLYEAYEFYSVKTNKSNNKKNQCIASKRYFEKVALEVISSSNFDADGMIMPSWWL
jgi:hypothetical protein